MNQNHFEILRMKAEEVQETLNWAAREGWNPGLQDATCFYQADPQGFFAGRLKGELIVVGCAVVYDARFAFCGLYIVKPAYRHQGYGMQLTYARLAYAGARITGIDGVLTMTDKYAQLGYAGAYHHLRYELAQPLPAIDVPEIVDARSLALSMLAAYDRRYFPAERLNFLRCWINQPQGHAFAYVKNGTIMGYGVIRRCGQGYKIAPLFAETVEIAEVLLRALSAQAKEAPIFIDVPEPNSAGVKLVEKYQMKPVLTTLRMYRNGRPRLDTSKIFGITTLELG